MTPEQLIAENRLDRPYTVVPGLSKPYKFAVIGKDGKPIAFTMDTKTAEGYAEQMNTKGFIETL